MIFAIVDCLTYLAERGKYSPKALTAQGLSLVTPETFAAAEDAPLGTVFVIHPRRSLLSWVVMYNGNSPASHVTTYIGGGYVCDASPPAVMIRRLSDVLTQGSWFIDNRLQPISEADRARIVNLAVSIVGTPYGWFTAARIGWGNATGFRRSSHPRLWTDTAVLLALPALIVGTTTSKRIRAALAAPAVAYVCLLTRNRMGSWAARRVKLFEKIDRRGSVGKNTGGR